MLREAVSKRQNRARGLRTLRAAQGEGRLPSLLHAPRDCGWLWISLNSYNFQEKVVPRGKGDKVGGDCSLRPLFGFSMSVFWLRL